MLPNSFKQAYNQQRQRDPLFGAKSGISVHEWWSKVIVDTLEASHTGNQQLGGIKMKKICDTCIQEFSTSKYVEWKLGAYELIRTLKRSNCVLAVMSNSDDRTRLILRDLGKSKRDNYF